MQSELTGKEEISQLIEKARDAMRQYLPEDKVRQLLYEHRRLYDKYSGIEDVKRNVLGPISIDSGEYSIHGCSKKEVSSNLRIAVDEVITQMSKLLHCVPD